MLSLGLIISLYWEKTLLCTLLSSPWHLRFSSLASENEHCSQFYVIVGYYYLWSFQVALYLTLGSFFTVYADQYSFECYQFSSVAQLCLTLCDPMNHSMPDLPVHHQLLEFTQTHIHWVADSIQSSHPLSSPSPPAPYPSQHQSLFQWVNSSHEVAKVLEF